MIVGFIAAIDRNIIPFSAFHSFKNQRRRLYDRKERNARQAFIFIISDRRSQLLHRRRSSDFYDIIAGRGNGKINFVISRRTAFLRYRLETGRTGDFNFVRNGILYPVPIDSILSDIHQRFRGIRRTLPKRV